MRTVPVPFDFPSPPGQEVEAERAQANDNVLYLQPLRRLFEKLNMMDDFQVSPRPGFHA